jgi:hypothetical protein|tara:strand:- start:1887 stop:3872 length:1986 start_codon:yes stop_codon:yes gene_type:complete
MSEEVDKTINSLSQLNKVSRYSALEFQGLTKSLLEAANGTEAASKRWTIFSRLVSGTPLWKMQNYLRGALGILAEMENTSKANAKAMREQNEKINDQITGYRQLRDEIKDANAISKARIQLANKASLIEKKKEGVEKKLAKQEKRRFFRNADKIRQLKEESIAHSNTIKEIRKKNDKNKENYKNVLEQVEAHETYNRVLLATNDVEKAQVATMIQMNKQFKIQETQMKKVQRIQIEAHAFDKSRLDVARKIAKEQAASEGKGRIGTFFAKRRGVKDERRQMRKDQAFALEGRKTQLAKTGAIFTKNNMQTALMPIAAGLRPVAGLFKLTKSAFLPFGKDARKFRIRMYKASTRIVKVMDFFFKYMMLGIVVAGAILIGMKYFQELYSILSEMGVVDRIKDLGKNLMSILGDVFSVVDAFIKGDYEKIVPLLGKIFDKAVLFLLTTLGVLLDVGFLALVAGFKLVGDFIVEFLENPSFREKIFKGLKVLLLFIAGFIVLKFAVAQLLLLAGIAALPVALGVVVLAAGFTIAKYFGDRISDRFRPLVNGVMGILETIKKVRRGISKLGRKLRKLPGFANGGVSSGGLAVVGERGPELVNLPAGARVNSNRESRKMVGGTTNNINITINARDTSDQELRRIADKIGQMVNTKINRTTSSRTFGG